MRVEIIHVEKRKLNIKKVIGVILAFLVIIISGFLGVHYAKKYTKTTTENIAQNVVIASEETNELVTEQIEAIENVIGQSLVIEEQKPLLPTYTEIGRNNINSIYNEQGKTVYLTFDDGPSNTVTPLILDVLKNNNIKATFFVLGSCVSYFPEITKRAYNEGHYIANHGYSHVYNKIYQNTQTILDEYNACEEKIRNAIGINEYSSHLFRFPGGSNGGKYETLKNETKLILDQNNIAYLDWNCLSKDSEGNFTKEELLNNIKETSVGKGNIVLLMHDSPNKILTYEILQDVINYFLEQGYTFGNMYDVMR